MYESEANRAVSIDTEIPADVLSRFGELRSTVAGRTLIPWGEHCTECVWPTCYTTCDLYTRAGRWKVPALRRRHGSHSSAERPQYLRAQDQLQALGQAVVDGEPAHALRAAGGQGRTRRPAHGGADREHSLHSCQKPALTETLFVEKTPRRPSPWWRCRACLVRARVL